MKHCKKCQKDKELSEFYRRAKSPDGYAYRCKECHHKDFELPDPKHSYAKEYNKRNHVKRLYGVTLEVYEETIKNGCDVCGSRIKPCLDHCHTTMKVRGCLCHKCNTALGLLDDNADRIMKLYTYIGENNNNG